MDLNGDGRNDILSGSYSPGHIFLFAQQTDGNYAAAEKLMTTDGQAVEVGAAAAAFAVDWDQDDDLDLVIGNISGEVYLVPNEGGAEKPLFGQSTRLQAGGQPIQVNHGDAGPAVADWDNDGLLDLVLGAGDGSVTFYRNTGTRTKPEFEDGKPLIEPANHAVQFESGESDARCGMRTKICVTDFNGDGLQDLLVGDFASAMVKPADQSEEEFASARAEYERVMKDYQDAYQKTGLDKILQEYQQALQAAEAGTDKEANQKKAEELLAKYQEVQQKELAPFVEKLNELSSKVFGESKYHGYVWYFQRQKPTDQTASAQ